MAGVALLVGDNIINKSGEIIDLKSEQYSGKIIGLYFAAHWCPPCREFTPLLAEFYNKYHESKKLEIIFISSDRDIESYRGYYDNMPWLSLEYKNREKSKELTKTFRVTGIPALILLDGDTGEIICETARSKVQSDSNGRDFPWKSTGHSNKSVCVIF
ncbi:unnamed protein product [Didymodactylos carnosus]|uniref:Thioredoxin domain-containing protein n=1 Tax=Didymodactylos carnosus TaxID=1234261 RepID=A0A815TA80_9BILA|nr:unnamed protein product [Didymodactylos carnosus]CAF1576945.1 unnamed protein product [Didymodactylos carnosus]CAF4360499.1 unnamed protein product [Didymodactylos carnosus]CAF4374479.1 unnamed protein product [Didymodactylos carnosus]